MDYKTSCALLLKSEAITENQAEEILRMWAEKPRSYHDFLKKPEASLVLRSYLGVIREATKHEFIDLETKVPSVSVALKFFSLDDDDISKNFINVASNLSFSNTGREICAWPYLTESCMQHLSEEVITRIIVGSEYVFDFSEDERGNLYDSLYKRLRDTYSRELFAANSFNVLGWINKAARHPEEEVLKYLTMSSHFLNVGIGPEAILRKFYIRYRYDIRNITSEMRQLSSSDIPSYIGKNFAN